MTNLSSSVSRQRGELEFLCNLDQVEAETRVEGLNALAEAGNMILNCAFYIYTLGEPSLADDDDPAVGLYRERVERCRHCGGSLSKHGMESRPFTPCGGGGYKRAK